jgi:hypothetical protein
VFQSLNKGNQMTKQYTKRERQMFVQQLNKARPFVEGERSTYVCFALIGAVGFKQSRKTCSMISSRLQSSLAVDGWLYKKHPCIFSEISRNGQWKEYRLAWIDNMIEEFSK